MAERKHPTWERLQGATVALLAPERWGIETPMATVTAVANEEGKIELLTHYLDADGEMVSGPVEKSATSAERVALGHALEARIEWEYRQRLAARVALDAGNIEEALALLAGAPRQMTLSEHA
jgi:hypothetical protein